MDIQRYGTTRRWSDIVTFGELVFVCEVPVTLDADIETQTREVLDSIAVQLAKAGSDKSQLLVATIYLVNLGDLDRMNAVWDGWVPEGCAPVRACLKAQLVDPGFRVEIQAIAAKRRE